MTSSRPSSRRLRAVFYFGLMSLLVNPTFLLDSPTSYMLKNTLQPSPSQIALFRPLTAIPFFLGFIFGLVRDLWNPFGQRDLGYCRIFVPAMIIVLLGLAFSPTSYWGLLAGMLLTAIAYSFIAATCSSIVPSTR